MPLCYQIGLVMYHHCIGSCSQMKMGYGKKVAKVPSDGFSNELGVLNLVIYFIC